MKGNGSKNNEAYSWKTTAQIVNDKIIPHFTHLHGLTLVEVNVLQQISIGVSLSNLSKSYFRSVKTLSSHKRNAFKKIGINTDAELVHYVHWLYEQLVNSNSKKNTSKLKKN